MDGQPGAEAEHAALKDQAIGAGEGNDQCRTVTGTGLQGNHGLMLAGPAVGEAAGHAEGGNHIAVRHRCRADLCRGGGRSRGGVERRARGPFGGERQDQQTANAGQRRQTEPGVHEPGQPDEKRRPRRIAEHDRRRARQKIAKLIEIAQALGALRLRRDGGARQNALDQRAGQRPVEDGAGADENARADQFQRAVKGKGRKGKTGQRQKRAGVAAEQNAVIDLDHVERAGKHQQVDGEREGDGCQKSRATGAKGGGNIAVSGGLAHHGGLLPLV